LSLEFAGVLPRGADGLFHLRQWGTERFRGENQNGRGMPNLARPQEFSAGALMALPA
jgi:hypothetical protein